MTITITKPIFYYIVIKLKVSKVIKKYITLNNHSNFVRIEVHPTTTTQRNNIFGIGPTLKSEHLKHETTKLHHTLK